ncbi:lysozyme inhibitor LprI family protein [Roseibium porphyridii]|uniref:Lysozyme inhibitor LprI family protein n=1 Tax=Roseibium porphyridii TaxID=2866279 RepID=A0ABY8F629_9HYPH|nr:lysozyme inhibitor LprI family protein [Roseibium sp. KMA01]WFE90229.1 lysozyme inhibitor LprI family protein [Roseibium sp. KMA01]
MFGVLWGLILAAVLVSPALAEEKVDCSNAMTQLEMTTCANLDWQQADEELNAAYKAAMAKMRETDEFLPEDQRGAAETLREAQRAWIPYRDKACDAYGFQARGGTMEPMLVYGCRAQLTEQRTKELEELTEGLGN